MRTEKIAKSKHNPRRRIVMGLSIGVPVAGILLFALAWGRYISNTSAEKELMAATEWDSTWPPLPRTGVLPRPLQLVRSAYAFAVRRPDVVDYMPCYCGCQRQGHRSIHDCFVKGATPSGVPV